MKMEQPLIRPEALKPLKYDYFIEKFTKSASKVSTLALEMTV
jgi:hypothetical protein